MPDPNTTRVILIVHSHWDREWYQPFEVFRQRLVRLVDRLMDILDADPAFASFHLDGQTIPLLDYEQIAGRSERLRRFVRAGRIKIGPWFVLPDEFLVGGEALIRNLERGFAICREFGAEVVPVGYLPDMFGHVAQAPQIFRGFGLKTAVVWRGVTPDVSGQTFTWEAPDGSAVQTVFLPIGYGYGSNLPQRPDLLFERVAATAAQIEPEGPGRVIGLFNGTDHVEPRAEVPTNLAAALAGKAGWSWEFGDLESFVREVIAARPPASRHRGELRSACRTLILPSVASARLYLKKQNFDAETLLARSAEPIAALGIAAGGADFDSLLSYAWGMLLENHPHDSICGCSVDAVHDEMETRFAKAMQAGRRALTESLYRIAPRLGPGLLVFHPAGPRLAGPVCGELSARLKKSTAITLPGGGEGAVQTLETLEPERLLTDQTLPREAGMILVGELVTYELFGLYLQSIKVAVKDDTLDMQIDAGPVPGGASIDAARAAVEKAAQDPRVQKIRARVFKLPRHLVAVDAPAMGAAALASFPLITAKAKAEGPALTASGMENERLVIEFDAAGGCHITDKDTGFAFDGLRFEDVGDRGDSYNFDPVVGDRAIAPERAVVKPLASGPVAAVMEVRHRFRLPASLTPDRAARSKKMVTLDVATQVRLLRGSRRVEFRTSFVNNALDHRLQVAALAPFAAPTVTVESAFGPVERPIEDGGLPRELDAHDLAATLLGREGTYTTSPHKTLAYGTGPGGGVAVMNRGLCELDARRVDGKTWLGLVLCRAVGWLSRPDLRMRPGEAGPTLPAPGAQCLRRFEWDWAVMPFAAGREDDLLASAHAFAYPPLLGVARAGGTERELWLIRLSNPRVFVSALRPVTGGLEARLVNASRREEEVTVEFAPGYRDPRPTDFLGRTVDDPRCRISGNTVMVKLRAQEIFTVRAGK